MESAATLERRRETLIKKAKEYHKELESLLVSSSPPHPFNFICDPSIRSKNLYKYLQQSVNYSNKEKKTKSKNEN